MILLQTKCALGVSMEKVSFFGWDNCYRVSNGDVELIVTADVGPRIIRFGFIDGENELKEFSEQLGLVGGNSWRSYGGHRLWAAPEDLDKTYFPDNFPVRVQNFDNRITFLPEIDESNHIQKSLSVRIENELVFIDHKITNTGDRPFELSCWALTVMATGGTAIVPLPERGSHAQNLTPVNNLALWKYTNLNDVRWTYLDRHILARQDVSLSKPQKLGFLLTEGWLAYANHGNLFVKMFDYRPNANYPDMSSSAEVFFDHRILELETLSPLKHLEPGGHIDHQEIWWLIRDFKFDPDRISIDLQPIENEIKNYRKLLENK